MADRPSVQVTTSVSQSSLDRLNKEVKNRVASILQANEITIEKMGEDAAMQIVNAIAHGGGNVVVGSKSFHVTSDYQIEQSPLSRILNDSEYIGEIGIPDPVQAMQRLKTSIAQAATYRSRVFRGSIKISARFNPIKLLSLNPHPAKSMPNGQRISVDSWLQWTVGPKFDSRGTPEHGLARVDDIVGFGELSGGRKEERALNIAGSSRTIRSAGADAGIMLKLQPINPASSTGQFESFTGRRGGPWQPIALGQNFWNHWWNRNRNSFRAAFTKAAQNIVDKVVKSQLIR